MKKASTQISLSVRIISSIYYYLFAKRHNQQYKNIPILMYHSISTPKSIKHINHYNTTIPPWLLKDHMHFLKENQYKPLSLVDLPNFLKINQLDNTKYVVITFDDAYSDFYTKAFPILKDFGYEATVFLPTSFINDDERKNGISKYLHWGQVKELYREGIQFGSHTVSHQQWKCLNKEEIEFEIKQSKYIIEEKIKTKIESFSYPYAFPEHERRLLRYLRHVLKTAGYTIAVTTRIGTTSHKDDILFLKRLPVNICDNISSFEAKLNGAYNWLFAVQYVYKYFKQSRYF